MGSTGGFLERNPPDPLRTLYRCLFAVMGKFLLNVPPYGIAFDFSDTHGTVFLYNS